ncbi:hypothetical protein ASZ90_003419 [hydrocarbon metagenome]|uniref:Uncharacterized protein n=1 Tax=hydrocarbon metagenome TaxID=938273 RepID=A0A0W8G0Q4_9ZZZZ
MFTGSQTYLLVALLVIILYVVYRPVKEKFTGTTLSTEEKNSLELE